MKTFEIKYPAGHSYTEKWDKTEYYCPNCGAQQVWMDQGAGDYYVGVQHQCVACGFNFTMPSCEVVSERSYTSEIQRLAALRKNE